MYAWDQTGLDRNRDHPVDYSFLFPITRAIFRWMVYKYHCIAH